MQQRLPIDDLEAIANEDVGEALRLTRLHFDQTLEDVEGALRIRASQIDAIECGDMSRLPGRVYAIGFVRSYAEFLGLDGAEAVRLFKAQYMDSRPDAVLSFPFPASETKTPPAWLVLSCIMVAVLFSSVWKNVNFEDHSAVLSVGEVPEDIKEHVSNDILSSTLTVSARDMVDDSISSPNVENMGGGDAQEAGIILHILEDSWVEIKNSKGDVIVSDILGQNEEYFVPNNPDLSMSLGNAAHVEIVVDGRALKPLGKDGDVRRDIPLNTAYLKTLEFKDAVNAVSAE